MSNRAKLFIPAAFFLVMMGLLLHGLFQDPSRVPSALLDRPLPQFSETDVLDPSIIVSNDQMKGHITLINFWGTWCPPCHAEHPYLIEISEREKDLVFVGVNFDETTPNAAQDFLKEVGNPFKRLIQDNKGKIRLDFGVAGAPETYVVDKAGIIRYKHVGAIDNRVWKDKLEPIIAQLRQQP